MARLLKRGSTMQLFRPCADDQLLPSSTGARSGSPNLSGLCTETQPSSRGLIPLRRPLWLIPLLGLLSACGAQPAQPEAQIVRVTPPPELLQDCPRPPVNLDSNGDLLDSLIAAHSGIVACNLRMRALRDYVEGR